MAKSFRSDLTGSRIAKSELTVLKVSKGSPLCDAFPDGEVHLDRDDVFKVAAFLGRPLDGPKPDEAPDGVTPPKPKKPRSPRKAG